MKCNKFQIDFKWQIINNLKEIRTKIDLNTKWMREKAWECSSILNYLQVESWMFPKDFNLISFTQILKWCSKWEDHSVLPSRWFTQWPMKCMEEIWMIQCIKINCIGIKTIWMMITKMVLITMTLIMINQKILLFMRPSLKKTSMQIQLLRKCLSKKLKFKMWIRRSLDQKCLKSKTKKIKVEIKVANGITDFTTIVWFGI